MWAFLWVAVLGLVCAVAELVNRYRDDPRRAIFTLPGICYLLLNGATAVLALAIIQAFGWTFGADPAAPAQVYWAQLLAAGTGGLLFSRSALLNMSTAEQDIPIGPGIFVHMLRAAIDRSVDRVRAKDRAAVVAEIMDGVSFERAHVALPTFCLALMQNLPEEDQKKLGHEVTALVQAPMDEETKVFVLGLTLMNKVGEGTLRAAVKATYDQICRVPARPPAHT